MWAVLPWGSTLLPARNVCWCTGLECFGCHSHVARKALFTTLRRLPGPWYAPWTHLWLKLQVLRGNRAQYIHHLHTIYGPFVRIAPTELSVADLPSFKTVHRVGSDFNKSGWYQKLKDAFFAFGGGSRVCLGIHLAMDELMLGAFVFFKSCPDVALAQSTTDESMAFENYFLIVPRAHRCEVTATQD